MIVTRLNLREIYTKLAIDEQTSEKLFLNIKCIDMSVNLGYRISIKTATFAATKSYIFDFLECSEEFIIDH